MFVIDTDPGTDDYVAMLMLMGDPGFRVDAVCSVYGNVDLANTTANLSYLMGLLGDRREVPRIFAGSDRPLVGRRVEAQYVHGEDGISGLRPERHEAPEPGTWDDWCAYLRASSEPIDILALGPLTNIARLIVGHDDIRRRIRRIVLQGGAVRVPGNTTAAATFNHYNDPVASAVVYESGIELVQVGNDVCLFGDIAAHRLVDRGEGPIARLIDGLVRRHWSLGGATEITDSTVVQFNDALCAAYLLQPELFTVESVPISIDWSPGAAFGATIADFRARSVEAPGSSAVTNLASAVQTAEYGELVLNRLSAYLS